METLQFCQKALREHIAPPEVGSVKERMTWAARKLRWSVSRVKDVWYADPRVSIGAAQMMEIEEKAGIKYGREEAHDLERLIERATALVVEHKANKRRSLAHAFRAFIRALDIAKAEG